MTRKELEALHLRALHVVGAISAIRELGDGEEFTCSLGEVTTAYAQALADDIERAAEAAEAAEAGGA